ncbi:MAG: SusD/RagB family nutrient-binding outer membrane lipoprotein [Candidatus Longimicrobiales bacterium M2_2A_002]
MRTHVRQKVALFAAVLLAASIGGCGDLVDLDAPTSNPNTVGEAGMSQLLVSAQVNSFFYNESELARISALWTQQLLGADRQFETLELFQYGETDGEDNWSLLYRQGGLLEIREGIAKAVEQENEIAAGILKIHEAYLVGMAASWWGAIPYSEAVNLEFPTPALDAQLDVYAAVQTLLSDAISDLQTGTQLDADVVGDTDMNFGADAAKWIAVAHSLKARFYLHVANADATAYGSAFSEAAQGVQDPADNWVGVHTTTATENNLWYMFQRDRSGYIIPDPDMVTMLEDRTDPRRDIYFNADADNINIPATASYDQPIVSCSETYGIMAEAALAGAGTEQDARDALQAMVEDCQEPYWEEITGAPVDIPVDAQTIAAADLLSEVMTEKYIAQFLNPDVWMDLRRTCLPDVPLSAPLPVAMFYPDVERQTNPNVPQSPPSDYTGLSLPSLPGYTGC